MAPVHRRCAIPHDLTSKPVGDYLQDFYEHLQKFWAPQMTVDTDIDELLWDEHTIFLSDTQHKDRNRKIRPELLKSGEGSRIRDLLASFYVNSAALSLRYIGDP